MAETGKKNNKSIIIKIAAVVVLLGFIGFSFLSFIGENHNRILDQNDRFIETATRQTADRLNEMFDSSMQSAQLLAHLYESVMDKPEVDSEMLQDMISRSEFDYVEFISADGIDLTAKGETADLSDRPYFRKGMQGESGTSVIFNSRITNETLISFYTPFYYENQVLGVLSCIMREETMEQRLQTDYFGMQGSTYLLDRDGNVLLCVGVKSKPDNLLAFLKNSDSLSQKDERKLEEALDESNSVNFNNFNYEGSSGTGSAYIIALENSDWVLVQSFPSSITQTMARQADSAGIRLEIKLIAAFLLYLMYLLIQNWRQRKRLISEKKEMSDIVGAVPRLFTRFALVNFEQNTYQYLGNVKSSAPAEGRYEDLIQYLQSCYVAEDKNGEDIGTVISYDYISTHLTEDVPYLQYEYEIDMDGRHWENISILCLTRKAGRPVNVLFAIQDVTALKEREQEIRLALKNSTEAAEAANQAKTDFLARMSHDIRTPMNAIMGMTAVAAMHMDDPERLTDCLSKITVSSRHLLALINDVLDMSKIESGKVTLSEEPFGMADMVDSIVTIIRPQANSRHQDLRVHISDIAHENVIGDLLRLRQVFVNILGNAIKFTPEEGVITFTIRECESLIHGMACYEFRCEDTGIGMDQEFIQNIFTPFSRSEESMRKNIEGTGLGMSITRNIVRMMEGDIKVESELGVGSMFTVQLHLKLQEEETENVEGLADLRVLVADDDADACDAACEILDSIGMKADGVFGGDEAIARIGEKQKTSESYAAVILDWKMPGKDGVETAREIRALAGEDLPIIILSAYDWSEIEAEAREAGIQAFIEKPLFRSRLVYALKSVLSLGAEGKQVVSTQMEEVRYQNQRVLLVEDNELNLEIAEELLSYIGIQVEKAENGKEAVDLFAQHPAGYYDLIFMDIQMPVMDGYEASRQIRHLDRADAAQIPIIAMTANAFSDDIMHAHDAGMNDHVAKPVEVNKLLEMLEKWLAPEKTQ